MSAAATKSKASGSTSKGRKTSAKTKRAPAKTKETAAKTKRTSAGSKVAKVKLTNKKPREYDLALSAAVPLGRAITK
jgi:hypothetical protein